MSATAIVKKEDVTLTSSLDFEAIRRMSADELHREIIQTYSLLGENVIVYQALVLDARERMYRGEKVGGYTTWKEYADNYLRRDGESLAACLRRLARAIEGTNPDKKHDGSKGRKHKDKSESPLYKKGLAAGKQDYDNAILSLQEKLAVLNASSEAHELAERVVVLEAELEESTGKKVQWERSKPSLPSVPKPTLAAWRENKFHPGGKFRFRYFEEAAGDFWDRHAYAFLSVAFRKALEKVGDPKHADDLRAFAAVLRAAAEKARMLADAVEPEISTPEAEPQPTAPESNDVASSQPDNKQTEVQKLVAEKLAKNTTFQNFVADKTPEVPWTHVAAKNGLRTHCGCLISCGYELSAKPTCKVCAAVAISPNRKKLHALTSEGNLQCKPWASKEGRLLAKDGEAVTCTLCIAAIKDEAYWNQPEVQERLQARIDADRAKQEAKKAKAAKKAKRTLAGEKRVALLKELKSEPVATSQSQTKKSLCTHFCKTCQQPVGKIHMDHCPDHEFEEVNSESDSITVDPEFMRQLEQVHGALIPVDPQTCKHTETHSERKGKRGMVKVCSLCGTEELNSETKSSSRQVVHGIYTSRSGDQCMTHCGLSTDDVQTAGRDENDQPKMDESITCKRCIKAINAMCGHPVATSQSQTKN